MKGCAEVCSCGHSCVIEGASTYPDIAVSDGRLVLDSFAFGLFVYDINAPIQESVQHWGKVRW